MKKLTQKAIVAALFAGMAFMQADAQVAADVRADFASAYVYRGATINDGAVLQPGIKVSNLGGFTFGAWGNLDLDTDGIEQTIEAVPDTDSAEGAEDVADQAVSGVKESLDSQFSEIRLYGNYDYAVNDDLTLGLGYTEYTFPYARAARTEADREFSVSSGLNLPVGEDLVTTPVLALFYGVNGGLDEVAQLELSSDLNVPVAEDWGIDLRGVLGYVLDEGDDGTYYADSGFRDLTLSAGTTLFDWVNVGLNYIVELDDDVLEVDEDFFVSVGVGKSF